MTLSSIIVPVFTLIGITLGWLLSFLTELYKTKTVVKRTKEDIKRDKLQETAMLLNKIEKEYFKLFSEIVNKTMYKKEFIIAENEDYNFLLRLSINFHLPELSSEYDKLVDIIQPYMKTVLFVIGNQNFDDPKEINGKAYLEYLKIESQIEKMIVILFDKMKLL